VCIEQDVFIDIVGFVVWVATENGRKIVDMLIAIFILGNEGLPPEKG